MKYLRTNYKLFESEINDIIKKCKTYNIEKYDIDDEGLLTVYGNVNFSKRKFKKIPLNFKEVFGYFSISQTPVVDLIGSPKIVHKTYKIFFTNITSLKSCPKEIGESLDCCDNYKLTKFIDFPKYINGSIVIVFSDLNSLFGCITNVSGGFYIYNNKSLKTLKYGPRKVGESYICAYCGLTSLYGAPIWVGGDFNCNDNKITSLKYSPKYIGDNFYFKNNKIRSFYYFPSCVGGNVDCVGTPVYKIWKLFERIDYIEYFNQMKIIIDENKINVKKLNIFLKSINKEPVEYVDGYINI